MLTDRPPAKPKLLPEFRRGDQLGNLDLPADNRLIVTARSIDAAMVSEDRWAVRLACTELLKQASGFYKVSEPPVRVLAARPLRIREGGWGMELFGDYDPETKLIRVWLRTAILNRSPHLEHSCGPFATSSAITWIMNCFDFTIPGTRAGFTSGRLCCTTMRDERRRRGFSGFLCDTAHGVSTGREQIVTANHIRQFQWVRRSAQP